LTNSIIYLVGAVMLLIRAESTCLLHICFFAIWIVALFVLICFSDFA